MSSEVIINKNIFALKGGEEGLKEAILQTAIRIHAGATTGAPTNKQKGVGGGLRNSIMWRTSWDGDGGFNSKGGDKAEQKLTVRPQGMEGIVGSAQSYAIYVNFGTRYMIAQPFLSKAGDEVRGATAAEIGKKYSKEAMEQEFARRKKTTRKL